MSKHRNNYAAVSEGAVVGYMMTNWIWTMSRGFAQLESEQSFNYNLLFVLDFIHKEMKIVFLFKELELHYKP